MVYRLSTRGRNRGKSGRISIVYGSSGVLLVSRYLIIWPDLTFNSTNEPLGTGIEEMTERFLVFGFCEFS